MTLPGLSNRGRLVADGLDNRGRLCEDGLDVRGRMNEPGEPAGGNPPVAQMASISAIQGDNARLNGAVVWSGESGGSITQRGFEWGESESYGKSWSEAGSWTAGFTFSHEIDGLVPGILYYARVKIVYSPP